MYTTKIRKFLNFLTTNRNFLLKMKFFDTSYFIDLSETNQLVEFKVNSVFQNFVKELTLYAQGWAPGRVSQPGKFEPEVI